MHLLSTRPGGHVDDGGQGVVRVAQTPGDIVVLSAADTTLALLADAARALPADFPTVRLANLMCGCASPRRWTSTWTRCLSLIHI